MLKVSLTNVNCPDRTRQLRRGEETPELGMTRRSHADCCSRAPTTVSWRRLSGVCGSRGPRSPPGPKIGPSKGIGVAESSLVGAVTVHDAAAMFSGRGPHATPSRLGGMVYRVVF